MSAVCVAIMRLPESDTMTSIDNPQWIDDVLHFWFEEIGEHAWFRTNLAVDQSIRQRFGPLHADVAARVTPSSVTSSAATLAAIIVLDQFSRNMYRASARAFAFDPAALAIARAAVDSGLDRSLGLEQRVFMYMPFQHSEDRAMQARSIELLQPVGDPNYLNYAQQHRDIIERFGRFPHRNRLLGRESTSAELDFLREHPGF